MLMRKMRYLMGIFLFCALSSGCSTPYHIKKASDFEQKILKIKTIGLIAPIGYESNKANQQENGEVLQQSIIKKLISSNKFSVKPLSKINFVDSWNGNYDNIVNNSNKMLKEMELEGIWRSKNNIIDKKFPNEITNFKLLDPELNAIMIVKCNHYYGNAAANVLYGFGLIGGLVAAATADNDPVIGKHAVGNNDTYGSTILIDADTGDVIWYNFVLQLGLNMQNEKNAGVMAGNLLRGLEE